MKKSLLVWLVFMIAVPSCGWRPPEKPDPSAILREAEADAHAGRCKDALAKHVWFHQHALEYQPALYGVRLSFALGKWIELTKLYPPALDKLRSIRDESSDKVLTSPHPHGLFHDCADINEELGEETKTIALFQSLEAKDPALSANVYHLVQPVLIRTGQPKLCARYLQPEADWLSIKDMHQRNLKMAANPKFGPDFKDYARNSFINKSTTLVALLTTNGRKPDADKIAKEALGVLKDEAFKKELDQALAGVIPAPWP